MYRTAGTGAIAVDEDRVRRWLADLHKPERLGDPVMRALLRTYGRDATGGPVEVGRSALRLLNETAESLRPAATAPAGDQLPYRVLKICFFEGTKNPQAARNLGVSERQLSRERTRAIRLLTAALASPLADRRPLSTPPAIDALVQRPDLWRRFGALVETSARVHVYGGAGSGKTSMVAAYVDAVDMAAFWYTVVGGINSDLCALLIDLGENLGPDDPRLARYLDAALPAPDLAIATRLALSGLTASNRIIVLDDFDSLVYDGRVAAFLHEAIGRMPGVKIITIGRRPIPSVPLDRSLRVSTLDIKDAARIAASRGVERQAGRIRVMHGWMSGNVSLFEAACRFRGSSSGEGARDLRHRASSHPLPSFRGLVSWATASSQGA